MECTLKLLGVLVFLPLGLQTGSVIGYWYHLEWSGSSGMMPTYEWSMEITLKHKMMELIICDSAWHLQCAQDGQQVTGLCGSPTITTFLSTTHTQTKLPMWLATTYLPSVLVEGTALSFVTCPVKTCSTDHTVTPLIREQGDWRLKEANPFRNTHLKEWPLVCKIIKFTTVCGQWRLQSRRPA